MGTIDRNKCAGRKALITGKVCRCGRCVGERETGWKKALVLSAGIERLIKGRVSTCRCVGLGIDRLEWSGLEIEMLKEHRQTCLFFTC